MAEMSIIGKGVARIDALEKLTGDAKYVGDLKLPHMLHCKIKRSTLPHARLLNVDISRAQKLTGVKAVVTASDTPDIRFGWYIRDETIFAHNKVRFIGEPIAAVAAIDEDTAEEASELIKVEYEELPVVYDPLEAMSENTPLIHEDLGDYVSILNSDKYGNVCARVTIEKGDVKKGFAEADFIFEDTFKTQAVHQCYLEPSPAIADIDGSGKVTLWVASLYLFRTRALLSNALRIPMTKLRLRAVHTGGAFGGKQAYIPLGISLLLAKKANRPVRLLLTREEEFIATNPRHPSMINIKTGVMKDGTLVSREARVVIDSGAFAQEGPGITRHAVLAVSGPYNIPHIKSDSYCVYTNKHPFGAYRGYGNPQAYFAGESQIDIIAKKLGIDPVEVRLKNCFEKDGDELPTGQKLFHIGLKETLKRISTENTPKSSVKIGNEKRKIGKGVACMLMGCGAFASGAVILVNDDGSFTLLTGVIEVGQGATTVLSQIAAEELGVTLKDISHISGDTDTTPWDFGSLGSRVTRTAGNAVRIAAAEVKKQLLKLASERLQTKAEELEIDRRNIRVKGFPDKCISIQELFLEHLGERGPIIGRGSFSEKGGPIITDRVRGLTATGRPAFQSSSVIAEVEVDTETGKVYVLKCVEAQDVGQCINRINAEGQIEGGIVQGIGYALTEEIQYEDGIVLNSNFLDYKIPTAMDVSGIVPLIIEEPDPTGPFGAKGIGEGCIVPIAPAIANAIYDAIGVRIKELPITPEKILKALKKKA
ncbi:xanthine dehydrogenase family protein molybdopterin-binding subunit [Chloroflexota bacterium]